MQARDGLFEQSEALNQQLQAELLAAIRSGQPAAAERALHKHQDRLRELTENLRIYQAELHAQADELATSQARSAEMLDRFSALFEGMPVAALLVAHNGQVLEFNAQAMHALQLRQRPSGSRFMHRLVAAEHFQAFVRPAFLRAEAEGVSRVHSITFMGEGGQRFVGDLHVARLPGRTDDDCTFACAVVDRTEHLAQVMSLERAAAALQRSEEALAVAARVARTGGFELTLRPRGLRWSAQLLETLDLGADAPEVWDTLLALCDTRSAAALAQALDQAERGLAFELELDMRSGLGRSLRILAVGQPESENGVVLRVHGVLQDITRQHLERGLFAEMSTRLSMANEAGGIGVWDFDVVNRRVTLDERMGQLLGLPAQQTGTLDEVLGPCLLPEGQQALSAGLQAALETKAPLSLELAAAVMPGAPEQTEAPVQRWLHLTGRAEADAQGHVHRLIGCAWDNTLQHEALRLRAAINAAESASQAKSAFLSRMSHELRTPLNAILGFSQLMRMEAERGDLTLKPHRVQLIESAARHLLELINEVLDVSRVEAGQLAVELKAVELHEVIQEALPMVQGMAERHRVKLQVQLPERAGAAVLADRLRLKEVVINLLSNAVKYNRPDGVVDVRIEPAADHLLLQVQDTGRGLDAQQMAGLFQPFNRLGAEASQIEGSGLGLFVSRRFLELMGATIAVESQPGVGTAVTVQLKLPPRSEEATVSRA